MAGVRYCLFSKASKLVLGLTQSPIQWVTMTLFLGIMLLENEADHLPPSNAQVDNNWSYTSTPPYTLMKCMGTVYFHGFSYYILH